MFRKGIRFGAMILSAAMICTSLPVYAAGTTTGNGSSSGSSSNAAVDAAIDGLISATGLKTEQKVNNAVDSENPDSGNSDSEKQESDAATDSAEQEELDAQTADNQDDADDSDDAQGDSDFDEFGHLVIAQVDSYVNVRKGPTTDSEKLGKLYNNSVGELIRREGDWLLISSGTIVGFVKSEYVVYGEEAEAIIDSVMVRKATVTAGSLNFRKEASTSADVIQHLPRGGEYDVLEISEDGKWVKIKVGKKTGYVSADYVSVMSSFVSAESKEEEKARLAAEAEQARLEKEAEEAARKAEEERKAAEQAAQQQQQQQQQQQTETQQQQQQTETQQQNTSTEAIQPADTSQTSGAAKGQAVVDFALQFVGNPYVYGGTSLTNGADCSGFVLSVYKEFGVKLPHSATADQKMGVAVASLEEARPGDLLCYSGHVGIYIGNGKFVHASNPRTGIKIGDANYRKILAIRRIFE